MNINYNGMLYLFDKNPNITHHVFYDRCWFVAKSEPKNEGDKLVKESLADIYINMRYLGCSYNKQIEAKVNNIIDI